MSAEDVDECMIKYINFFSSSSFSSSLLLLLLLYCQSEQRSTVHEQESVQTKKILHFTLCVKSQPTFQRSPLSRPVETLCSMLLHVHRDHTKYCKGRGAQDGRLDFHTPPGLWLSQVQRCFTSTVTLRTGIRNREPGTATSSFPQLRPKL